MGWYYGSIPIMMYPANAEEGPPPGIGFLLITDFSDFLLTDMTPMETAGP
jgi:hypothetical protein